MLERLQTLFEDTAKERERPIDKLRLAVSGLLLEASATDGVIDMDEREQIARVLASRFSLTPSEAGQLMAETVEKMRRTENSETFAREINASFNLEGKKELVEVLWQVVYADGKVHEFEDILMRQVTARLGVSPEESDEARRRAERLMMAQGTQEDASGAEAGETPPHDFGHSLEHRAVSWKHKSGKE